MAAQYYEQEDELWLRLIHRNPRQILSAAQRHWLTNDSFPITRCPKINTSQEISNAKRIQKRAMCRVSQESSTLLIKIKFKRCRINLKTVKNVTLAEFELAFTRCWINLKTVGNSTVINSL